MTIKKAAYIVLFALAGCTIENDIPFPIVDGSVTAIEVEGQCDADGNPGGQAVINKSGRTVSLYVDDTQDLSAIKITKLTVSNDAAIIPDSTACSNFTKFPKGGFESISSLPMSSDTKIDFTEPVSFTLRTYQDYIWKINITRIINRTVRVENQIGNAVVDAVNRNVVIYVSKEQALDRIKVTKFDIGGTHGTVVPDPTSAETYDFSSPTTFHVKHGWESSSHKWTIYVYHTEGAPTFSSEMFPMSVRAFLKGETLNGKEPVIEYKKKTDTQWNTLASSAIYIDGTSYSATIGSLSPDTEYVYKVTVGDTQGDEIEFKTAPATVLTDGDFDNWHAVDKLWNPWAASSTSFWDTGNRGATTISESNSVPTDDTCTGKGKAALLESKYLVLKFAAGNIFTGSYLKTVGTNGVLSFGRPFSAFPSKLRVNYKYETSAIDKTGDSDHQYLKGRPDSCHIYIALTDWDEPLEIRTKPSERQIFDKNDPHVIAYSELINGENVDKYTQVDLPLEYRYNNRTPKFIVVVASSSKYGDYFTGGTSSKLWIDNFELIYE